MYIRNNDLMDKSGIFVGATVGSISVFIIFTVLFIISSQSDETANTNAKSNR